MTPSQLILLISESYELILSPTWDVMAVQRTIEDAHQIENESGCWTSPKKKNSLKSTSRCSDGRLFRFLLLVGGRRARSKNTAGEEEDDPSWLKTGPGLSLYTTETVPYKSVVLQIRLTNTTASKRQCRVFQFVDYKKCKAKKRFTSIPTLLLPSKEKMDDHHKKHNRNVI